jgi:hypothetical protein
MRTQHVGESEEKPKIPEIREESVVRPIKMYNETLYSKGFIQKKPASILSERKQPLERSSWENLGTIEHNVDDIECKKTGVRETRTQASDDIDQKVDRILYRKKVWQ